MTTPASGSARPGRHRRLLAACAALALLALTGACSSGAETSSSGSTADASMPEAAAAPADAAAAEAGSRSASSSDQTVLIEDTAPTEARALIKTGNVALRSDDVPTARFDVGKVLDVHGGEVAEESTQADEDGDAERVRLVLRVPVAAFDATMTDLQAVADLIDVGTTTEDVSTEVIDNEVRVALQRRSIERISVLLDSAADLRDIVSIERELAGREAELGSLEQRQTFLADQTAMATITVSIEPPRAKDDVEESPDDDGFLAGLSDGWSALTDVTTGLLTVGGAALPFALVVLLLAVPTRLVVRRFAARPTPATGAGPVPAGPAT